MKYLWELAWLEYLLDLELLNVEVRFVDERFFVEPVSNTIACSSVHGSDSAAAASDLNVERQHSYVTAFYNLYFASSPLDSMVFAVYKVSFPEEPFLAFPSPEEDVLVPFSKKEVVFFCDFSSNWVSILRV